MLTIEPISAFIDNYIWCLHNGNNAVVVDPGDASVVIAYMNFNNLTLVGILITHHHKDHIGGVNELKEYYNNLQVFSSIPEIATHTIIDGQVIKLETLNNLTFNVMTVPGHTLDHIVFHGNGILFCGDTLFSAGCGRVFEGTYEQMHQSLMKIKDLDDNVLVYCAHEYTLQNMNFAKTIEPNNMDLIQRYDECVELRRNDIPTLPVKLGIEKRINPFLRCNVLKFDASIGLNDATPEQVFAHIRVLRNNFVQIK